MGKFLQVLAVVALAAGLTGGVSASDDVLCDIYGTGADSINVCKVDNDTEIEYKCEAGFLVENENDQEAESGDSESEGNTEVGDTTTGDATNENVTKTEIEANCAAAHADKEKSKEKEKEKEKAPEKEDENGQVQAETTDEEEVVEALPVTGENDTLITAAGAVAGFALLAVVSKLALNAFQRFDQKL